MAALYQRWESQGAEFHYVTASPWQLYPTLIEFIGAEGFPRGSMHMRSVRLKDRTVFMDFRNNDALRVESEIARTLGYVGKVAIHPGQIPVITGLRSSG